MEKSFTKKELGEILAKRIEQLRKIKSPRVGIQNLLRARRNELRELADALDIDLIEETH